MNDSIHRSESECRAVEELIAWYPTGTLAEDERHRVELHVGACESCADLLQFTADFKGVVLEAYSSHPKAEILVSFVEDRESLDARQCDAVEEHLEVCADCREQVDLLETVGSSMERGEIEGHRARLATKSTDGSEMKRRGFWGMLWGGFLKPVPAAIYLVVAIVAVGWLLFRPGDSAIVPAGQPSGVVILPDETRRVREMGPGEGGSVSIESSRPQYLLLELTGLESPPREDDVYMVEFRRTNSDEPVLSANVVGAVFRENYTIGYQLGADALEPGRYVVVVTGPEGRTAFRASLVVR